MNLIIHGYSGHMGQILAERVNTSGGHFHTVAGICPDAAGVAAEIPLFETPKACSVPADLVIDFSQHTATAPLLSFCVARHLPVIVATTGHTEEEVVIIEEAARRIPVFFSANMSLGIALLLQLAKETVRAFPDADIEIVEAHHNRKLDVPSGTAWMIAKEIQKVRPESTFDVGRHEAGKRTKEEIGIHSLRLGNVVGMHEVIVATDSQTITLKHEAASRALFADGALRAADYLIAKPAGLYTMQDIVDEMNGAKKEPACAK